MENKISRYEEVRLQIKNGDVIMYTGKKIFARLISWLTRSSYSHAGIAVWWNERLMVMEAVMKGDDYPLSRNIYQHHGNVEWFTCKKRFQKRIVSGWSSLRKRSWESYARWKALLFGLKILLNRNLSRKDQLRIEEIILFSICCSNLQFHWFRFKKKGRSIYVAWRYCQIALNGKRGEFKIEKGSIELVYV
jgi:hypothetical protein